MTPKRIFLLDGFGALFTALILLVFSTYFNEYFGMPQNIVIPLVSIALIFSAYSILCAYLAGEGWRKFLLVCCVGNALYCCLTIGLVYYYFDQLTSVAIFYFVSEIVVIGGLVWLEIKTVTSTTT